jgi:hypothetical protein
MIAYSLFFHPTLDMHLVVRERRPPERDALWLVPKTPDGWRQRRPYRGPRVGLYLYPPPTARAILTTLSVADEPRPNA